MLYQQPRLFRHSPVPKVYSPPAVNPLASRFPGLAPQPDAFPLAYPRGFSLPVPAGPAFRPDSTTYPYPMANQTYYLYCPHSQMIPTPAFPTALPPATGIGYQPALALFPAQAHLWAVPKGLAAILIAILVLAALDLLFVRPQKLARD